MRQPDRDHRWPVGSLSRVQHRHPCLQITALDDWDPRDDEEIRRIAARWQAKGFRPDAATVAPGPDLPGRY